MDEKDTDWGQLEAELPTPKTEAEYAAMLHARALVHVIKGHQQHIDALEAKVNKLLDERDSMLKWGVMTLGGAVILMAGYIWHLFADRVFK